MVEVAGALGATCCSALCCVLSLVVVIGVVRFLMTPGEWEVRAAADRKDPARAWLQGTTFILQRGDDYGYVDDGQIGVMLEDSWGVTDLPSLRATVADLEGRADEPAWNLLRAMLLLRSATAMGWVDNEASFRECFRLGARLQSGYPSWEAMGEDLLRSRRAWRELPLDGSDDDDDMELVVDSLNDVRKSHWSTVPWTTPLR